MTPLPLGECMAELARKLLITVLHPLYTEKQLPSSEWVPLPYLLSQGTRISFPRYCTAAVPRKERTRLGLFGRGNLHLSYSCRTQGSCNSNFTQTDWGPQAEFGISLCMHTWQNGLWWVVCPDAASTVNSQTVQLNQLLVFSN